MRCNIAPHKNMLILFFGYLSSIFPQKRKKIPISATKDAPIPQYVDKSFGCKMNIFTPSKFAIQVKTIAEIVSTIPKAIKITPTRKTAFHLVVFSLFSKTLCKLTLIFSIFILRKAVSQSAKIL